MFAKGGMIYRLSILIFIFISIKSFGQNDSLVKNSQIKFDTVKFVNGSKQAAKIIEISEKYVKYKNPYDLQGPTFVVKRRDIQGFVLKDGCLDLKEQGFENCVKDPSYDIIEENKFKHSIISIDISQLFIQHFQFHADYVFKNKKHAIGIFGNFGINDPVDKYTFDRKETTALFAGGFYKKAFGGIDYKIFPTIHKKITYFCSLGIDIGKSYFKQSKLYAESYYPTYIPRHTEIKIIESLYLGYRFTNGFVWRITKHFLCQGSFTLGVNHFNYYSDDDKKRENTFLPKFAGGFLVGYAF
jgi:hypothetical protein